MKAQQIECSKTDAPLVSDESKCVFGLTGQMKQASLAVG